jgi:cyclopropane fatty-acyl-phospholipid synthase-like methyltransferase
VGNVLSYYENSLSERDGVIKRRIIDKFEIDIGVDNEDLMTLESEEKYDAIVSVSTVEHIGQGLSIRAVLTVSLQKWSRSRSSTEGNRQNIRFAGC